MYVHIRVCTCFQYGMQLLFITNDLLKILALIIGRIWTYILSYFIISEEDNAAFVKPCKSNTEMTICNLPIRFNFSTKIQAFIFLHFIKELVKPLMNELYE